MGDRLIEEAENDPNIKLSESPMKSDGEEGADGVNPSASYGQSKLNQLFSMMHKSQKRTDEVINDFERNFGLRLQKLTDNQIGLGLSADYMQIAKELQGTGKPVDLDDPVVDAEIFEKGIKRQFGELKKNFRGVVDNIRTNELETFHKVNEPKAKKNESAAYSKLELELQKIKQQIDKANQAKAMFDEFFADVKKPPQPMNPIKNHTDAQLKRSPYAQREEMVDSEGDELDESMSTMKDGKIDFDELFKRSNKLHSRTGT
jgi:hypothetical protein